MIVCARHVLQKTDEGLTIYKHNIGCQSVHNKGKLGHLSEATEENLVGAINGTPNEHKILAYGTITSMYSKVLI